MINIILVMFAIRGSQSLWISILLYEWAKMCHFYGLYPYTWFCIIFKCGLIQMTNSNRQKKEKKKKERLVKNRRRQNPANRLQLPAHRGVLQGHHLRQRTAQGQAEESKETGSERLPLFIGCGRLGKGSQHSGGAQFTVFNECEQGRRRPPLILSSVSEDARKRGSTNHGRPDNGCGTCPGVSCQEPFVWQGSEMGLMLRTEGLCSWGQICWGTDECRL